jgi:hypothetical protein
MARSNSPFKLRFDSAEVIPCDSCNMPAPTDGFDWGPPYTEQHDKPQRLLCLFCATTMCGAITRHAASSPEARLVQETWKSAAAVYNLMKHGGP